MTVTETTSAYYRKGFGLKAEVQATLAADYTGGLVDRLRAHDNTLVAGGMTIRLAREFGFCYGVERAVEYAYQTRTKFPDRRIYLAGQIIHDLGLRDSTLTFAGTSLAIGLREDEVVAQAWDLDAVRAEYEQLILRYSGLRPEPGDPMLFTHIQMVNEWQRIPFLDPQLPDALLPDWIGRRAAVVFGELRARWHDGALARWHEVAEETAPS